MPESDQTMAIGQVTGVFGIKGWVKVYAYTDPKENVFNYQPWLMDIDGHRQQVDVTAWKRQGKGLIVQLNQCNDRDQARRFCGLKIHVSEQSLPELESGDYYWSQLIGLTVVTLDGTVLGSVQKMMETGANDVVVVRSTAGSLDDQERLIPYLPDRVVMAVDLESGVMKVDWQPEY